MIQCINRYLDGVKLLLEHGADVNIKDGQGNSALILACRHYKDYNNKEESAEVIKLLATKGVNINEVSVFPSLIRGYERGTGLFEACIKNRLEIVTLLLELGAATDDVEQNPLIESCALRNTDVARLLVAHGANMNVIDNGGRTSLSISCKEGYDDLVELLLDHGADMNLASDTYSIKHPLLCATAHDWVSTVKLLLDRGADVHRVGDVLPLNAACEHGQVGVARLLLEREADVNGASRRGQTPLITAACSRTDHGMIDLLLEYGADINAESRGCCALEVADAVLFFFLNQVLFNYN